MQKRKSYSTLIAPRAIDDDWLDDYDDRDDPLEDYKFDLWRDKQMMAEEEAKERKNED